MINCFFVGRGAPQMQMPQGAGRGAPAGAGRGAPGNSFIHSLFSPLSPS